ncbi:MAG TPA: helix-turn-helix domain-containing protein [Candidatus Babeliales bacterium]|jgi:DNA-binding HxlR family transcriptional regulator|nr:helix-turn-helix domain-containing protein [Candidatus Babeliales bacterium]
MTNKSCAIESLLHIIGQRWNAYILWILHQHSSMRFGNLKRNIPGISQKVLTAKLRELESYGIITRVYEKTVPPTVHYSLSTQALDLIPVMQHINQVAIIWREKGIL